MKFQLILSLVLVAFTAVHAEDSTDELSEQKKDDGTTKTDGKTVEATVLKSLLGALSGKRSCGGVIKDNCTPAARRRLILGSQQHRDLVDGTEGEDEVIEDEEEYEFFQYEYEIPITTTKKDDESDTKESKTATELLGVGGLAGAQACLKRELKGVLDTKSGEKCATALNKIHEKNFPEQPKSDELTDAEIDRLFASAAKGESAGGGAGAGTGADTPGGGSNTAIIIAGAAAASAAAGGLVYVSRKKGRAGAKPTEFNNMGRSNNFNNDALSVAAPMEVGNEYANYDYPAPPQYAAHASARSNQWAQDNL